MAVDWETQIEVVFNGPDDDMAPTGEDYIIDVKRRDGKPLSGPELYTMFSILANKLNQDETPWTVEAKIFGVDEGGFKSLFKHLKKDAPVYNQDDD